MSHFLRPLAVVTGASSGIGFELARLCAGRGYDLVLAADEPEIHEAAASFYRSGVMAEAVRADLATREGIDQLQVALRGRPVEALLVNAGHGPGHAFLDQDFDAIRHVVDTNITGTLDLIHRVGRGMRGRGRGRILITGSVAGFLPGAYQAVDNGTKAFIDSFALALRAEFGGTGVTVTCLMPGPTDTRFFERADMLDTRLGAQEQDDPADVARVGFDAMLRGEGDVVSGWENRFQVAMAHGLPAEVLAERHRRLAEPGPGSASASGAA